MTRNIFRQGWIRLSLRDPLRRFLYALAMACVVLPLGYKTARIGLAGAFGSIHNRNDIRRAIVFDPANPRLYERMGQISQSSFNPNPGQSVRWFQKAAMMEPANAVYWQRLAESCQIAGDRNCATAAFRHALWLAPVAPRALWLAANQDLLAGAPVKAESRFRRLLAIAPGYAKAVFTVCLRAYGDPRIVGTRILPAGSSPSLQLAYVNFLADRNDFPLAGQFWSKLVSTRARFHSSLADPYLEKLIASGRIAQARQAWHDLRRLGILPAGSGGNADNLVFNPGFERNPLNAGFGWRFRSTPYVETEFADSSAHGGARCLRMDYVTAENQPSQPVWQLIPVSGEKTYRLSAWVRSLDITSNSGPRLRVTDPEHPGCFASQTQGVVGTTAWHQVSVKFSTCRQTELLRLSVWRPGSRNFPGAISGHFWLDDVTLTPVTQSRAAVSHHEHR